MSETVTDVSRDEPGDPGAPGERSRLLCGTRVEVRGGFDGSWVSGFVVEEVLEKGYRLRRRSDSTVLPTVFAPGNVRRERKNSMWWI